MRRTQISTPQRSFTRRTNFNPEQTSVTAQTFTSTRPAANPISRTACSSTSVGTPELFLGQLTQSIPAGASCLLNRLNSFVNSVFDFVNSMAKSSGDFSPRTALLEIVQFVSAVFNSASASDGAPANATRNPSLIPSFLGSGVPEYPGMVDAYRAMAYQPRRERTRKFLRSLATISMVR